MGSLIKYSGINTKTRAMRRWSLKEKDFQELAAQQSVPAAVDYLKKFKPYAQLFQGVDEQDLHRELIEQKLNYAQLEEYGRLYRFADQDQKKFLDLYFIHYEVEVIKRCLRNVAGHVSKKPDLTMFQKAFERNSKLDPVRLAESDDMESFVKNLKGTPFYAPLDELTRSGNATLAEYESALDMVYFKTIWEEKDKYLSKGDAKIVSESFGMRVDMLNIQWIWRSKKFYNLPTAKIKSMLIPFGHHLKEEDLEKLSTVEDLDQLHDAVQGTWYGKYNFTDENGELEFEQKIEEIIERSYQESARDHPNSPAVMNEFLHAKEKEIHRIITAIEKIRYGAAANAG